MKLATTRKKFKPFDILSSIDIAISVKILLTSIDNKTPNDLSFSLYLKKLFQPIIVGYGLSCYGVLYTHA